MPNKKVELSEPAWRRDSAQLRNKLDITSQFKPWTGLKRPTPFKQDGIRMSERVKDILDCATAAKLNELPTNTKRTSQVIEDTMQNIFCDYSQSHLRRNWTNRSGTTHVFTTATELYSFAEDRTVLPIEMLRAHGYGPHVKIPQDITPSQLKDIVGRGIALPCLASVIWGLYVVNGCRTESKS